MYLSISLLCRSPNNVSPFPNGSEKWALHSCLPASNSCPISSSDGQYSCWPAEKSVLPTPRVWPRLNCGNLTSLAASPRSCAIKFRKCTWAVRAVKLGDPFICRRRYEKMYSLNLEDIRRGTHGYCGLYSRYTLTNSTTVIAVRSTSVYVSLDNMFFPTV